MTAITFLFLPMTSMATIILPVILVIATIDLITTIATAIIIVIIVCIRTVDDYFTSAIKIIRPVPVRK